MKHAQDHFSSIAPQYVLGRIGYPEDLYRFLGAQCYGHNLAWDCATGSGQAALDLVRAFSRVIEDFKAAISSSWPERSSILHGGYSSIRAPLHEISSPTFEAAAQWELDDYLAHLRSWSATRYYRERTGEDITQQFEPAFARVWRGGRVPVKWPLILRVFRKE